MKGRKSEKNPARIKSQILGFEFQNKPHKADKTDKNLENRISNLTRVRVLEIQSFEFIP